MDRYRAMQVLRRQLSDQLVVAGLGNQSYDLYLAGDRPTHFYMWGAMGLAPSVALGVCLAATNATVVALEGDGGLLMNLGALATIGAVQPANLVLIVFDNQSYDLTGGQRTATRAATDLAAVARGCGLVQTQRVTTLEEFSALLPRVLSEAGPWCVVVDTGPTPADRRKPLIRLRRRFLQLESFIDAASTLDRPERSTS